MLSTVTFNIDFDNDIDTYTDINTDIDIVTDIDFEIDIDTVIDVDIYTRSSSASDYVFYSAGCRATLTRSELLVNWFSYQLPNHVAGCTGLHIASSKAIPL